MQSPKLNTWLSGQTAKWRRDVAFVVVQARTLVLVFKHPQAPWYAKVVSGSAALYLLSPIQLIPTFIPVIGQLDDLLVLWVGTKVLRRLTPKDVLAQCEIRASVTSMAPGSAPHLCECSQQHLD